MAFHEIGERRRQQDLDALGTCDGHLLQHDQGIVYSTRRRITHKPAQRKAYFRYEVPASATNAEHGAVQKEYRYHYSGGPSGKEGVA